MRQYNYIWGTDDVFRAQLTVDKDGDEYTIKLIQHALSEEALINVEPTAKAVTYITSQNVVDDIIISVTNIVIRAPNNPRPESLFRLLE